jgi:hypothetical protein
MDGHDDSYFGKESSGTSTTCALPFGDGYSITVSFVYVILFCVSVVANVAALSKRWKVQDRVNSLPSQSTPLVKNMWLYCHGCGSVVCGMGGWPMGWGARA